MELRSTDDLIAKFGGLGPFSREIGVIYVTAQQMKRRNSISPDHWPAIVAAARRRGIDGVSFEVLARLREQRVRSEPDAEPVPANAPSAAEGQGA